MEALVIVAGPLAAIAGPLAAFAGALEITTVLKIEHALEIAYALEVKHALEVRQLLRPRTPFARLINILTNGSISDILYLVLYTLYLPIENRL